MSNGKVINVMKALYSFQTSFNIYQEPQCNILQDLDLQLSRCRPNTRKFDEYQVRFSACKFYYKTCVIIFIMYETVSHQSLTQHKLM